MKGQRGGGPGVGSLPNRSGGEMEVDNTADDRRYPDRVNGWQTELTEGNANVGRYQ